MKGPGLRPRCEHMDEFPQMLYRVPGSEPIHGGMFATLVVGSADERAAAIADGWALSTEEAKAPKPVDPDDSPPTRAELEQKAAELGIKVDGRWSDRKLRDTIAAALEK